MKVLRNALWLATALLLVGETARSSPDGDAIARGEYLFRAAGCAACHTDKASPGEFLAGGRQLPTPYGVFFGPNITPDPRYGIGRWTEEDFVRALREGISPDGRPYFPAFPYPAFAQIGDDDLRSLWSYLRTVRPANRANLPHELRGPFGWRVLVRVWNLLYFTPGPFRASPSAPALVERGRYLATALGHCGECHTPRTALGGLDRKRALAGSRSGPDGGRVPNLTPDAATGLGRWSDAEIREVLRSGLTPEGDFVGGGMGEVVQEGTSRLTEGDRAALSAYLKSLPPRRNDEVKPPSRRQEEPEW